MKNLGKSVLFALAAVVAACGDGTVAPRSPQSTVSVAGGGSTADLSGSDTVRFSFVIDPSRSLTYSLGSGNTITFPAGSLCDLSSPYGASYWDQPCAVATSPVTINARAWLDRRGHPRVDFDKHVRFVPSLDAAKWVTITFTDASAASSYGTTILYCPNASVGHCVDESKTDPSLATYKDPATGRMMRRIKHFSGYNVFSGQPCDPSPSDPDCIDSGDGGGLNDRITSGASSVGLLNQINGLVREHSLPDHPHVTANIGPEGGSLSLPQAGLTLIVPRGAVNQVTRFGVTAVAGTVVAYEFEPHGTTFNVPLTLRQELGHTQKLYGGHLVGAYFAEASQLNPFGGKSQVNELLDATINPQGQVEIKIRHFSGYMLGWA